MRKRLNRGEFGSLPVRPRREPGAEFPELLAGEPVRAAAVQVLDAGAGEPRHVALDVESDLGLDVAEVAVSDGELGQQIAVQLEPGGRVDRVEPVLLVDRLAQDDPPAAGAVSGTLIAVHAPLEEVVEAAGADHVALDAVHLRPLRDRHLGLRDRPVTGHIDRAAPEEVQDVHATLESLAAYANEISRGSLEPGRHHEPVVVPDGGEALPVAGVAPDHPVLDQIADQLPVVGHAWTFWTSIGTSLVGGIGGPGGLPLTSGVP
jgi:hypothetical protein